MESVLRPVWRAAGYVQRDYSVGVLLKDLGKVLTVSYAHNIDPTSSVGAEVTKKLEEKEATVFALGCPPVADPRFRTAHRNMLCTGVA